MSRYDNKTLEQVKKTGTYRGQKLTGRLEVRLPMETEMSLIDLIEDNSKTKSEVLISLLMKKRLYTHLSDREQEIFYTLTELRLAFTRIKSSLQGLDRDERLKFFRNNPDYMENWIACINQCIDQWNHVIKHLSE